MARTYTITRQGLTRDFTVTRQSLTRTYTRETGIGPRGEAGADGATGPAPSGTGLVSVTSGVLDTPSTLRTRVAADAANLRTDLGLVIGTDVQAYDAELAAIAGLTSAADKGIQFTGAGTAATFDLTAAGKALLDDADAAAQRTTLGLTTTGVVDASATAEIDWQLGTVFTKTLSFNTTFTFANIVHGKTIQMRITGAFGYGINWPAGVTWAGSAPLAPSNGATLIYEFTADSGSTVRGFVHPQTDEPLPLDLGGTGGVTASAARTNLGLGTLATQSGTFSGASSGTNTGDQTAGTGLTLTAGAFAIDSTVTTLTGTQTLTNKTLTNPSVNNYTEGVVAIGTVTSSHTLALTSGTVQTATLTASTACTFTMPTATAGKSFVLYLKQAASTGNGTATFTDVKWSGSTAPTITATAGRMDILSFVADGTNWYGSAIQNFTA